VNTAQVSGTPVDEAGVPFPDPPPLNPTDTAEVDTLSADVSIAKTNNADPVEAGTTVIFTLAIANAGPDPAVDVVVVDVLPVGVTYVETPSFDGWDCSIAEPKTLTCLREAPLPSGESDELAYDVVVERTAPLDVGIDNVAAVSTSTTDPDPTNNEDTSTVVRTVFPPPVRQAPPASFSPPAAPAPPPSKPATPVEPTPLAHTGSQTPTLITLATGMLAWGGLLAVGARRRNRHFR